MTDLKRILFVYDENSNRSQMAEAFTRLHGGDSIESCSAGSRPFGQVNPKGIESMRELGYDLSQNQSESLETLPDVEFDFVATRGYGDDCPLTRVRQREDCNIPDLENLPPHEFRQVRDLIEGR